MPFERRGSGGFRGGGGGGFRGGGGGGFRGGGSRFGGPREMHKAVCAECKQECEVPFKPREGSPVYCKDCFLKRKGITPREMPKKEETEEVAEEVEEEEEEIE